MAKQGNVHLGRPQARINFSRDDRIKHLLLWRDAPGEKPIVLPERRGRRRLEAVMSRNNRRNPDDPNFEMVLMRRFHLTPGQPEYVFIKRRVSGNDADPSSSRGGEMPRGDKSKYTNKQKRKAEHIEQGYEQQGVPEPEAEKRAWATVNKMDGGGKHSGSGRGKPENKAPARKGGKRGGTASAARSSQSKSESARKAAKTRSTLKARLSPSATG